MAREIRTFTVTIPTGSTKAAPHKTRIAFPPRVVRIVRVRVPPGPLGVMGFALGVSGTPLIPYNATAFIVADDETFSAPVEGYPTSGDWWVIGYNTGTFTHTIQVTFELALTGGSTAFTPPTPISVGTLSTGGTPLPATPTVTPTPTPALVTA